MSTSNFSLEDLLTALAQAGIVSSTDVDAIIDTMNNTLKSNSTKNATQRSDGRWMAYANLENGRKSVYGKTKAEAIQKANTKELLEKKEKEHAIFSFENCFYNWRNYKLFNKDNCVESQTVERYEQTYNKYYKHNPISQCDIRNIDSIYISNFLNGCIKNAESMTYKEYHKLKQIIKDVMGYTSDSKKTSLHQIDWDQIKRRLPAKRLYTSHKNELAIPTDVKNILFDEIYLKNMCRHKTSYVLCLLLNFSLGLRISELSAIKWSDIDYNKKTIKVTEAGTKRPLRNENGDKTNTTEFLITSRTKTPNAHREIPLTDRALNIIELIKVYHNKMGYSSNYLAFEGNNAINTSACLSKTLTEMCKKAGVTHINSHLIRKSFATSLHEVDISIKQISLYLGHSDMITTERNYIINPNTDIEEKRKAMSKAL